MHNNILTFKLKFGKHLHNYKEKRQTVGPTYTKYMLNELYL